MLSNELGGRRSCVRREGPCGLDQTERQAEEDEEAKHAQGARPDRLYRDIPPNRGVEELAELQEVKRKETRSAQKR